MGEQKPEKTKKHICAGLLAHVSAGSRGGVYLQRVDLLRLRSGVSDFGVSCHRGDVVDWAEERIKILLAV